MTAPNLPLTALPMAVEMLDGTEPIIQKLLQGTTVSPLFISNVFNQARLAHNLAAQVAQAERRGIEKGVEMAIEAASEHLGHEGENCPPHIVDEIRALLTEVPHD